MLGRTVLLTLFLLGIRPSPPRAETWEPVPAEDLARSSPTVEKDTDVEILLSRVRIDDEYEGGNFSAHGKVFVRMKLFTERAVRDYAKIPYIYPSDVRVDDMQARTVRPDGTSLDVPHKAFFDRVLERQGRRRLLERSFAPPGLAPGVVVEYRVEMHVADRVSNFLPIILQAEQPVRRLELHIHPLDIPDLTMMCRAINCPPVRFAKEGGGEYVATLERLPAFRREPLMPADDRVRAWLLVYYQEAGAAPKPEEFWRRYARERHDTFQRETKPDRAVKEAAAVAVAGATDDAERLVRLAQWCRTHVRNLEVDSTVTASARAKRKPSRSPSETLERGAGTWSELDWLIASMARACGFDVRLAAVNTRTDVPLDLSFAQSYFVRSWDVAVRSGDRWLFFDPGAPWLPIGMLPWDEEGATAIITGPDEPLVATTPLSDETGSVRTSVADFTLTGDGNLEGNLRVTLTGHLAAARREEDNDRTPSERLAAWVDDLHQDLGPADITAPKLEANLVSELPYVYACHILAHDYAQRAGRRLLLRPAVFRRQAPSLFPASERHQPVALHVPWSERDTVHIHLPEGFTPEGLGNALPLVIPNVARHALRITLEPDGHTLIATRDFHFGEEGRLLIPAENYPDLKSVFDTIRENDAQTLVLTASEH